MKVDYCQKTEPGRAAGEPVANQSYYKFVHIINGAIISKMTARAQTEVFWSIGILSGCHGIAL